MNRRFVILRSLDPYHQRIGYLAALVLAMYRGLDSKDAVRSRLREILWERLNLSDSRVSSVIPRLAPKRRELLKKIISKRKSEDNPASILEPEAQCLNFVYASELWLHQDCMRSPVGLIPENRIDRILDLARWVGIMSPTIELTESGFILRTLLQQERDKQQFNPLDVYTRPAIRLLFFRLLLGSEVLWPILIKALIAAEEEGRILRTRGTDGLLSTTVEIFLSEYRDLSDPSDALDIREIIEFHERLMSNDRTQENYLRPRMEILVDLGLIERSLSKGSRGGNFPWSISPNTRRLNVVLTGIPAECSGIDAFLDNRFFASMANVYAVEAKEVKDNRCVLLWFARAYLYVGRDIGFTPGRTISLLACLMAFEHGRVLEISQVFNAVYAAANSEWNKYFRFSGGSRFDREFMVSIDDTLIAKLEQNLASNPEVSK